jgi:hypothetical protein
MDQTYQCHLFISGNLEDFEVMQDCQQCNDHQDHRTTLHQVLQDMFPEETDDRDRCNNYKDDHYQPNDLVKVDH